MNSNLNANKDLHIVRREDLPQLFNILIKDGHQIVGPTLRDGAIVLDVLEGVAELPLGWTDEQDKARYRLVKRKDEALFGYSCGPQTWKKFLFPPDHILFKADKTRHGWRIDAGENAPPKFAFLGMRACDIHALTELDKVFIAGEYQDSAYLERRENIFIISINCSVVGNNCFCTSMGSGPGAASGYDLALTEIIDGDLHYYLIEVGSEKGEEVLGEIKHRTASQEEIRKGNELLTAAAQAISLKVDTEKLPKILKKSVEHPRWKEIASRCLTCGNCTMVCPTCFCSTVQDYTDLRGSQASRLRKWDSCFNIEYSYIHGGSVRYSSEARYRQWMMHKFASWIDQFGSFGCVGCGRCITWCPAGIDVTEELRFFCQNPLLDTTAKSA
ncbi:4Fe-4S dicluster domain-containing protein [bacterium]|nr:4Fe-4S dicluster domain-containing protein [bacterium]